MGSVIRRVVRGLALLVAVIALPSVSWAVVSGQQSLQVKVWLKPSKAGKIEKRFSIQVVYENPTSDQQPPYNTHKLIISEPPGLRLNPRAVTHCSESAVLAAGNASVCPAKSTVGSGTALINARPAVSQLITATVTAYNGVDDTGYAGFPKGSGALILYVQTSIGINDTDVFHIVKGSTGNSELVAVIAKPSAPGVAPGSATVQRLDLTLTGWGKKPYLINPPTCSHSWPFSVTVTNYFGQPSVTSRYKVKCTT